MKGCKVGIQNKMKIQIYLENYADCVERYNSLEGVDQTNVRTVSGNDLGI